MDETTLAGVWDEAVQALAWAMENGPTGDALRYVADHNPYGSARPARPTPGEDEDGFPATPEGWSSVILGTDTETDAVVVLAGWTADGTFVQYAPTEAIVTVCVEALGGLSEPMETDEHRYGGGE